MSHPVFDLLSPRQAESLVRSRESKVCIWSGSVSSGKTFTSLWAFLMAVRTAPHTGHIIMVGRTLGTVETNLLALLQDPAIFGMIAKDIVYTPGAKTAMILGRTVYLYGANSADAETKIRGITACLAYVDEATILPEGFWDMLMTRLRVPGARCLATTNPGSKGHWLRKKWILPGAAKDVQHWRFTMEDNPSLDPAYVALQHASFSGVFYDRFIRGLWTNATGAIFPDWDPDRHVLPWEMLPPIERTLSVGIDYGTTNTTAALMLGLTREARPRLILLDEWAYSSKANHGRGIPDVELSKRLRAWLTLDHHPEHAPDPEFVFLDPSAASMRAQLAADGLTTWKASNEVEKGLGSVASLIARDRLYSTTRTPTWNTEVTEYQWDAKEAALGNDVVRKVDDHAMDAGRYAVQSTYSAWANLLTAA